MELVLDNSYAERDFAQPKNLPTNHQQRLGMTVANGRLMELMRAFLFAQSYGRHLQQTAFDRPMKISVWLDSIDQHDGIGPGCVAILVNSEFARSAKLDHLHAAADRHAHRFFGDPIV